MSFLIEAIMGSLIELFVYFLIELLGYCVARIVLPLISFDKIIVHPLASTDREGFNWFGYRRGGGGHIEIEPGTAGFLGFLILLMLFVTSLLLIRAWG